MLKDKLGDYTIANISNAQPMQVNIPIKFWKFFELGKRIKIYPLKNDDVHIVRKIISIGSGRQRIITIPKQDNDIFKAGERVRLYI